MTNINNFKSATPLNKDIELKQPEKVIVKVGTDKLEQLKSISIEERKVNYQKQENKVNSPILKSQTEIMQDIEIGFDKAPPKEKEKPFLEKLKRLTSEFNGFGIGNYAEMGKVVDKETGHIIERSNNEYIDTETGKTLNKEEVVLQRKLLNDIEPSFFNKKVAESFSEIHTERKEGINDISNSKKLEYKNIDDKFAKDEENLKNDTSFNNITIKSLKGNKNENGIIGLKAQHKSIDEKMSKEYDSINKSDAYSFTNKISKITNQDWEQLKNSGKDKAGIKKVLAVTGNSIGFIGKATIYRPVSAVWAGISKSALLTKTSINHSYQKAKASAVTNIEIAKIKLDNFNNKLENINLKMKKFNQKAGVSFNTTLEKTVVWSKAVGKGIAITIGKPIEVGIRATVKTVIQPALNLTGGVVVGLGIAAKSGITVAADLSAKINKNHNLYTFSDSVKAVSSKVYDKYLKTNSEKQIDELDRKMAKVLVKNTDIEPEILKIKESGLKEGTSEFIEKVNDAKFNRFKQVMNLQAEKITKTRDEHFGYTSPLGIKGTLKKWAHISLDKNTIGVGVLGSSISGGKMMSQAAGAMQAANLLSGISGGATGLGGLITAKQGFKEFNNAKEKHDKAKEFIKSIDSVNKIDNLMVNNNQGNDELNALKNIASMVKDRSALKSKLAYASTGLMNAGSGAVTLAAVSGAAISATSAGVAPLVLTGAALLTTGAIYGKKIYDVTNRQSTIDQLNLRMGLLNNTLNKSELNENDKKILTENKKEINSLQLRKDPDVAGKAIIDISKEAINKVSQQFKIPQYKAIEAIQEIFSGEKTEKFSPAELKQIKDSLSAKEIKAFELSINIMGLKVEDINKPSGAAEIHNSIPLALWTHVKVSEDENGNIQKQFNSYSNKVKNVEKFDNLVRTKTNFLNDTEIKNVQIKNEQPEPQIEKSATNSSNLSYLDI